MQKIYNNLKELQKIVQEFQNTGKTVVWTNGCFDILHPGHLHTFREAKKF